MKFMYTFFLHTNISILAQAYIFVCGSVVICAGCEATHTLLAGTLVYFHPTFLVLLFIRVRACVHQYVRVCMSLW